MKKISENIQAEIEEKVNEIILSDQPQTKVFNVRKNRRQISNIDFPLKDENGVLQVSREGINQVILKHFKKVFNQNKIHDSELWKNYWKSIDECFDLINNITSNKRANIVEPSEEDIVRILVEMKASKATYGTMTIDLVQLCGIKNKNKNKNKN